MTYISALKTRMARELKQAIHDEEVREKKREEAIKDLRNPNSKIAKELSKRHKEERERGRLYIRQLQYDNEVIFLHFDVKLKHVDYFLIEST